MALALQASGPFQIATGRNDQRARSFDTAWPQTGPCSAPPVDRQMRFWKKTWCAPRSSTKGAFGSFMSQVGSWRWITAAGAWGAPQVSWPGPQGTPSQTCG